MKHGSAQTELHHEGITEAIVGAAFEVVNSAGYPCFIRVSSVAFAFSGSSGNRVGEFQSFGSIQVKIFSRKYSSSR